MDKWIDLLLNLFQHCIYSDAFQGLLFCLQIVGYEYDSVVDEVKSEGRVFETFESLLDNLSPMYQLQFGMEVSEKLKHLVDDQK